MIRGKSVLGIVPARGGSKGVSRKNIRLVAGKPLITWTIEEAKKSRYIDRLVLSSEDPEIIQIAQAAGCEVPFVRPAELSRDETPGIVPVLHALGELPRYDCVILLQPTSPLRSAADIDGAIEFCVGQSARLCVSVCEADKSPYWMYSLGPTGGHLQPLVPFPDREVCRQDLPKAYVLNGAIFLADTAYLTKQKTFLSEETRAYVMPRERSLDIDTEWDFFVLENYLNREKRATIAAAQISAGR